MTKKTPTKQQLLTRDECSAWLTDDQPAESDNPESDQQDSDQITVQCIYVSVCEFRRLYWRHTIGDHVIHFGDISFTLGEKRLLYGVHYKKPNSNTSNIELKCKEREKGLSSTHLPGL